MDEYRQAFDKAAQEWMVAAAKRDDLEPIDTAGAMFCAGINHLIQMGVDRGDVAEWVRAMADALEAGAVNGPAMN